MGTIVEMIGVNKRYGSNHVVKDLNLTVNEGEFLTLLGSSGCGKTTTLRIIAGFLEPTSGDVFFDGKRINGVPVTVKTYLDADNYSEIVNTIANSCFDESGAYRPEYREIARRYVIIKYMTDIDLGEMGVSEVFKCTQGSAWFASIATDVTKLPIWAEIEQAVDEIINYKNLTRKTSFDNLCEILSAFAEKMGDTKSLDAIADKLANLDDKAVVEAILDK